MQTPTGADESGQGCGSSVGIAGNITHTDAQPHVADARDYQEDIVRSGKDTVWTLENPVHSNEELVSYVSKSLSHSFLSARKKILQEASKADDESPQFDEVNLPDHFSQTLIKIEDSDDVFLQTVKKKPRTITNNKRVCKICFEKTRNHGTVSCHHVNVHFRSVRFICSICGNIFHQEDKFVEHCKLHNGDKPFYCLQCNTWFHYLHDLNNHIKEFQDRDFMHCFACGECSARKFLVENGTKKEGFIRFTRKKMVISTLYFCEKCHPRSTHDCQVCGQMFKKPGGLSNHYNSSHCTEGRFRCKECFTGYSTKCILESHVETHPGRQKPWTCHVCGIRFQLQYHFMSHLLDHKALKPFTCEKCGKDFRFEHELKSHQDNHRACESDGSSELSAFGCVNGNGKNCTLKMESDITSPQVTHEHFRNENGCIQPEPVPCTYFDPINIQENKNISSGSETSASSQEHSSFPLVYLKQEVLSDEEYCDAVREHIQNGTLSEGIPREGVQNFGSQKVSSGSLLPSSTSAAGICGDGDRHNRQTNSLNFSSSDTNSNALSEEKHFTSTSEVFTVKQERQSNMQCNGEVHFPPVYINKDNGQNGSVDKEVTAGNEINRKVASEIWPLDFLSTETTSCRQETLTDIDFEIPMHNDCTPPKDLGQMSDLLVKTEPEDFFLSDELNIQVDIKEDVSSCLVEESVGNVLPRNQENQHGAFPVTSYPDTKLENQRQPLQDDTSQAVVSANCCICRSLLGPSTSLLQHYRNVHHFEPNFLCKICSKFFDTDSDLRRHTGAVHKATARCLLCERKFLSQPALEAHYRKHSCGMPYHCTTCRTCFRDLDELEHHRSPAGAREQAHYCGRCSRKNAWKYQGGPGQTRTYFCEECGALVFKRLVLCETCGQLFNGTLLYENHYIHQHTGRHRCNRCDTVFDSACVKEAHVESMCGTWKMFTCTICGRRLQSRDKLSEHEQVHQLLSF